MLGAFGGLAILFGAPTQANELRSTFELGPWEAYLVNEITPSLRHVERPAVEPVTWVQLDQALLAPPFAQSWMGPQAKVSERVRLAWVEPQWGRDGRHGATLLGAERARIEQSLIMPGVTTQVNAQNAVTVSAVLAAQRFVNPGMNLTRYDGAVVAGSAATGLPGQRVESVHGLGLRVANQFSPWSAVVVETAYQSRIDMNPLATLQGVHGAQAQLDIPSRFETEIRFALSERLVASVGASHIFYSEVGAFPSRAMPARFSSLLGDSTSPEFAWRNLSVFTAGLGMQLTEQLSAHIEYDSRAQPRPTSKALSDALGNELTKHAWRVGLTQKTSERASVFVSAAYAPPEYVFGGHILGVVSDQLEQSLEVQALWQVFF
ncbi:MAG TPA: hypothetical protein VIC53_04355 [Wenzhouxiangella sp.]